MSHFLAETVATGFWILIVGVAAMAIGDSVATWLESRKTRGTSQYFSNNIYRK
jgi:hypothetical protein